jgi:hypothetical protein
MITKQDLLDQREQMQEDARCILDGIDDSFMDNLCGMIVDRMNILINNFDNTGE